MKLALPRLRDLTKPKRTKELQGTDNTGKKPDGVMIDIGRAPKGQNYKGQTIREGNPSLFSVEWGTSIQCFGRHRSVDTHVLKLFAWT